MNMPSDGSDTAIIEKTPHLLLRIGPLAGTNIALHCGQVTTLGRASTNQLVIPDQICSRNHCAVFFDAGVWKLRDLASRNGTRVNGEPITGDVQLTEGRQFQIGNTVVSFAFDLQSRSVSDEDTWTDIAEAAAFEVPLPEVDAGSQGNPEIIPMTDKTHDQSRTVDANSAPIRTSNGLLGSIQLYSTNPDNRFESDDAKFILAVAEQLAGALDNLKERSWLAAGLAGAETESKTLREQSLIEAELVGDSTSIRRLREKILRIAPTGATVLIRGESGVGKELVARAIHQHSNRADGPFVTMNCAALSESLLESELFGHEKGSFTGAVGRKIGKFEQADSGTIFLDEVGEMSPSIQAKVLRVLDGHPYERVGGGVEVVVNVRVVAATNCDLEYSVDRGRFRKDLYFRLQVMELAVEPLRDRRSDIVILAKHFMQRFSHKCGRSVTSILPEALATLTNYDWPGNIRELQNTIGRAVILCSGNTIGPIDIQLSALGRSEVSAAVPTRMSGYRPASIDTIEQEHILAMLEWTKWNKSKAADILQIERSTLDRKLKKYEIERPSHRKPSE